MEKNTIWMPYHEAVAYQELMKKSEAETQQKMAYFFWNNFSMKGYEDFKLKKEKENGEQA